MEQPQLFPQEQTPPMSMDEMAAHITANARPVEYEDRTSEAAREQGHGPVSNSPQISHQPARLFEVPGLNRGRVNQYDQPVTPAEAQRGMTTEEIDKQHAINSAGAAAVRAQLSDKNP